MRPARPAASPHRRWKDAPETTWRRRRPVLRPDCTRSITSFCCWGESFGAAAPYPAFLPGGVEAGAGALAEHGALELGEGTDNLHHHPPGGGGGINRFGQALEGGPCPLQLSREITQQVFERAGKPVELPHDDARHLCVNGRTDRSRLAELAEAHRTGVQMFGGIYGGGPAVPQAGEHSPALVELAEQHEARLLARDEAFSGEVVAQIERENESPAYVIEADGDRVMVPEVEGADMDVGDDVEITRDQQGNYEAEAGHDYGR
jgi:hypothetical protein